MKHWMLLMAVVVWVSGCGGVDLTDKGREVKLMKNDPPGNCKHVEDIEVEEDDTVSAKAELRNLAAEKNADYVRLDILTMKHGDAIASGALYQCSGPAADRSSGASPSPEKTSPPEDDGSGDSN
ncbi:MAG: hypothetical protein GWM98_06455 [Nitrospinaceae bacterium]|nr:hypothetical protein [Nitrospinaceae bacterium]NIR54197.1 hypothetical protein [Nitrospinaceae bacterium]NIS84612.1 hypothetical protein [Nitrospinaceae bacterium]NIT81407.1 hypothetical protein [Nitrospinaceae bacterium]NIU43691.1 hypothetical protein [Nitrospinaceae bacterium]